MKLNNTIGQRTAEIAVDKGDILYIISNGHRFRIDPFGAGLQIRLESAGIAKINAMSGNTFVFSPDDDA
jgi:hypothetical protein